MSEFFEHPEIEWLNKFLTCCPFSKESDDEALLSAFQIGDGVKAFIFCGTWAAITRGAHDRTVHPDFARASSIFPPIDPFLKHEGKHVTRRSLLDHKSLGTPKHMAKGNREAAPSSVAAVLAATGSSRPSILRQAMNMQRRTQSSLLNGASGNIVCCATAFATAEMFIGLHKLSNTLSEAIAKLDDDCEKSTKERKEFKDWAFVKVGAAFMNFTILIETKGSKGIGARITLDGKGKEVYIGE
ncbi:hypothetical protein Peur_047176 [Populus x canadensis]